MTGFGSNSCEFSWGTVIFEISSVNSKYQDFATKFPRELASLETKMMNLMRNSIGRGRVRLYAEIAWNSAAQIPQINEEGFINLYNQIKNIAENNN